MMALPVGIFSKPDAPRTVFNPLEGYLNWTREQDMKVLQEESQIVNAIFVWAENKKYFKKYINNKNNGQRK